MATSNIQYLGVDTRVHDALCRVLELWPYEQAGTSFVPPLPCLYNNWCGGVSCNGWLVHIAVEGHPAAALRSCLLHRGKTIQEGRTLVA